MPQSGDSSPNDLCGIDLAATAPFAELMGSVYLVGCHVQGPPPGSAHQVFGAFHGIDFLFLSMESMIETCIEWAEQAGYDPDGTAPDETEIWQRHNPGVPL